MRNSLYYAVSMRQNGMPLGYNLLVVLDCLLKMYREKSVDVIQIGKKTKIITMRNIVDYNERWNIRKLDPIIMYLYLHVRRWKCGGTVDKHAKKV